MAFGLGKLFGKKAVELKVASRNLENKDLMEAAVDGMLLMAYSKDKSLDAAEETQIKELLRTHPKLGSFGEAVTERFNLTNAALKAGYISARVRILREIEDVKSDANDKADVFAAILEVALADGKLHKAERAELVAISSKLSVDVGSFVNLDEIPVDAE